MDQFQKGFAAYGIADPPLPDSSWSKRRFEKGASITRDALRRLEAKAPVSSKLADPMKVPQVIDLTFKSPEPTTAPVKALQLRQVLGLQDENANQMADPIMRLLCNT